MNPAVANPESHTVNRGQRRILRAVTQTEKLVECANCGRPVREADAEDLG